MFLLLLIAADIGAINCILAQQADLSFGRRQVEQVICDRPDMGEIILREPALRQALERRFAGEVNSSRVYWDDREPVGPRPAEHMRSKHTYPAVIRVSRDCGAVDKCAMLLLELNNFEVDREFERLIGSTPEKRKSPDDFATSCVQHEFEASRNTQTFFKKHPITDESCSDSLYYNGLMASNKEDFAKYLRWLDGRDSNAFHPLQYYRQAYYTILQRDTSNSNANRHESIRTRE